MLDVDTFKWKYKELEKDAYNGERNNNTAVMLPTKTKA